MSSPSDEEKAGSYFIDVENAAEMARLLAQDRVLTQGMGGLLAERGQDVSGIHSALDLACGPGGWALDLAATYPEMEVWGVDISALMTEYARSVAKNTELTNIHFQQLDVTKDLNFFPNACFDLINIRFLAGFLKTSHWLDLFRECKRLLRPGGTYRITESELVGVSTSPALEKLATWLILSLWKSGQSFAPGGRRMGSIAVIPSHFRRTGYQFQGTMTHLINYDYGSPAHESFCADWASAYKLVQPFYVKMDVATQEEIETTYTQMLTELQDPGFCGCYDLHTFWGSKPTS
jgi:SAM-dependent methyltransferase